MCAKALGGATARRPDGLLMYIDVSPPFTTHAGVATILGPLVFSSLPEHLVTIGELLRNLLDYPETSDPDAPGAGCDVRLPLAA